MSKIYGLVFNRPRTNLADALNASCAALWHEGYEQEETWHDEMAGLGHLGLGAVSTECQPVFDPSKKDAAVFCGKIFDTSLHRNTLSKAGVHFQCQDNDAELLLNLLNVSGRTAFRGINGIFSIAVWNRLNRRLTLVNDRYGLRSLYYHHDAERGIFVFSSELKGVVDSGIIQPGIDWRSCANFLYLGHHLGDTTWFEDVHMMPPASLLTFENNQVKIERYWDINSLRIDEQIDYPTALEECKRLFSQAISRQNVPTNGTKSVFLSGGLDSRRIAAELKKQGGEFESYTVGWDEESADPNVARQVADVLGVRHSLVKLPLQNLIMDYWPRCNALLDYEAKIHHWILPLIDALPREVKVNYDGLAGDIPFNGMARASEFYDPEQFAWACSTEPAALANRIAGEKQDFRFLAKPIRSQIAHENVVASIRAELDKYGGSRNQLNYYYIMNRTRRAVALFALRLLTLRVETFFPFLDNDLFDFVMSLPPELKMSHQLRRDMLGSSSPELLNIPTAGELMTKGVDSDWQQHPAHCRQRRKYFLHNVRYQYLQMNWAFDNLQTAPRILKDVIGYYTKKRHISFVFSEASITFYRLLERYFPKGI